MAWCNANKNYRYHPPVFLSYPDPVVRCSFHAFYTNPIGFERFSNPNSGIEKYEKDVF